MAKAKKEEASQATKPARRYVKIGTVMENEKGSYVILGDNRNPKEEYNYSVELRVLDSEGKVVHEMTNGFLSVFDPRNRPGISDEQRERIPAKLLYELVAVKPEQE